jgi:chromosome partitioning protein
MPTIVVAAQKEGAGKTTLAINLAVCWPGALVVDLNREQAAVEWSRRRDSKTPAVVPADFVNLPEVFDLARARNFSWVIVDTPSHTGADWLCRVLAFSNLALVPSRPGLLDLTAAGNTARIIRTVGAKGAIVLNACPPESGRTPDSLIRDARVEANRYGVPVSPILIARRSAFLNSVPNGWGVTETEPHGKAAGEILALQQWIEQETLGPARASMEKLSVVRA